MAYSLFNRLKNHVEIGVHNGALMKGQKNEKITVNVGVLAYNHEKYIVHCLNSIIKQKGDFNLNIVICEDKSSDRTAEIVDNYINNTVVAKNVTFNYLKNQENLGMVKNLKKLLRACSKSKYTALIDGDDYWCDENKLKYHIEFMESHPQCAMSFDDLIIKEGDYFYPYYLHQQIKGDIFNTEDIANLNFIGNISCGFYHSKYLGEIPDEFFEMFVGDWMLNVACSTFGEIGHVKKAMSVYRIHNKGIWNRMNNYYKNKTTIDLIDEYNKYFNYTYDEQFSNMRRLNASKMDDVYLENYDLVIIDNLFPHDASGFRYEEFLSYLKYFNSMKVLIAENSLHLLGDKSVKDLIIDFKRKIPEIGSKLEKFCTFDNINCKLLYFASLQNVASFVHMAEDRKIPFIFSLYQGEGFALDDPSSEESLKTVTRSPCFRKVMVTQRAIYNYLTDKNFCKPEQIEFIVQREILSREIEDGEHVNEKYYGFNNEIVSRIRVLEAHIQ